MDYGILEIKLLPAWSPSSVLAELKSALAKAQLLQAGIAYWTVSDDLIGASLPRVLNDNSGFLCVDLHLPTDIDALATLVRKGAQIYLHCEEIATPETGRKEPRLLLHTKMLLLWSNDRTVELWIGSHNWTKRSILGLNIESSIVIRARDSSILLSDAAQYLQKIKHICEPFDLSKVDFYKEAQRNVTQHTTPVIALEGKNAAALGNITFALFGTDEEDLKDLGTVRREVDVKVFDSESEEPYHYPALILQSGLLSGSDPSAGGISFSRRRYAFRRGRRFPALKPEGEVGTDVLATAKYFVTLKLESVDDSIVDDEYVPPKSPTWIDVNPDLSPILQRLDSTAKNLLFGGQDPHPKRPRSEAEGSPVKDEPPRALTLAELRSQEELRLVTRRILRRKR